MKCLLFAAKQPAPPEITSLKIELEQLGHTVDLFDPRSIPAINLVSQLRERISEYDVIYHRTGLGEAGAVLLYELIEPDRQVLINPAWYLHPMCTNKLYQAVQVNAAGISIPKTYLCNHSTYDHLAPELGNTFIAKAAHGIQGNEVYKIENEAEFLTFQTAVAGDQIAQQLIPNDGDFRVFMVGDAMHAVYKRVLPEGSYRSNMSLGATGEVVENASLRQQLHELGRKITTCLQLDIAGVDIIQHSQTKELYFLEANINPGWRGLDSTLGTNTAAVIAGYFVQRYESLGVST